MVKYISVVCIFPLLFVCMSFVPKPKQTVTGVWKIVEVQTVKQNGEFTSVFPLESQVIFCGKYYSFCWTNHSSTVHTWQMTDSVKLERMNKSMSNAGVYELKNSILTTTASFAMNPMFVKGVAKFKCSFAGDTLILTGLNVLSEDNIQNPAYANGLHFVSKLIKVDTIK